MQALTILCSDLQHPIYPHLQAWAADSAGLADVRIIQGSTEALGGDLLLLISCHEIIKPEVRDRYKHTLVVHASDLPQGKGMSPHVWQILEGKTEIVVTLLEAVDGLDAGDIWHQERIHIPATALHEEIHDALFGAELKLMSWALLNHNTVIPRKQSGAGSFYRKRKPEDSLIPVDATLEQAFNQLRIADPKRYPAFFEHLGVRYKVIIERM